MRGEEQDGRWRRAAQAVRGIFTRRPQYVDLEKDKQIQRNETRSLLFPPMHLLPPHVTVTDLKLNRTTPSPLFTVQSLLLKAINGVTAASGSAYGISLTTVELFRDLVQCVHCDFCPGHAQACQLTRSLSLRRMLALLVGSAVSPLAPRNVKSWFETIAAFLALDFVSIFGRAVVWLWIFTALGAVVVFELHRLCGSLQGRTNDLGEGFDCEQPKSDDRRRWGIRNLRKSYWYRVAIAFSATTLYLPLSQVSFGALFWTSDFWVSLKT